LIREALASTLAPSLSEPDPASLPSPLPPLIPGAIASLPDDVVLLIHCLLSERCFVVTTECE
jgi:hypothetical protein